MSSKKAKAPAPKASAPDPAVPAPKPCVFLEIAHVTGRPASQANGATHPSRRQSVAPPKEDADSNARRASASIVGPDAAPSPSFRLEFELQTDVAPRTCENFRQFALGGATVGDKKSSKVVGYKGTRVLRAGELFVQCGDVLNREDGKGQESIYGPSFDDEHLAALPHRLGVLTMVNSGPNTNGSQFAIITAEDPDDVAYMGARHQAFGTLLGGEEAETVLRRLHAAILESDASSGARGVLPPTTGWTIVDCGLTDHPASRKAHRSPSTHLDA